MISEKFTSENSKAQKTNIQYVHTRVATIQCVDILYIASGVSRYSDILHDTKWSLNNGLCKGFK